MFAGRVDTSNNVLVSVCPVTMVFHIDGPEVDDVNGRCEKCIAILTLVS